MSGSLGPFWAVVGAFMAFFQDIKGVLRAAEEKVCSVLARSPEKMG